MGVEINMIGCKKQAPCVLKGVMVCTRTLCIGLFTRVVGCYPRQARTAPVCEVGCRRKWLLHIYIHMTREMLRVQPICCLLDCVWRLLRPRFPQVSSDIEMHRNQRLCRREIVRQLMKFLTNEKVNFGRKIEVFTNGMENARG